MKFPTSSVFLRRPIPGNHDSTNIKIKVLVNLNCDLITYWLEAKEKIRVEGIILTHLLGVNLSDWNINNIVKLRPCTKIEFCLVLIRNLTCEGLQIYTLLYFQIEIQSCFFLPDERYMDMEEYCIMDYGVMSLVYGGVLWCLMPLSAILISVMSWQSVLLVEETRVSGEKTAASHWQTLSHNVVSSTPNLFMQKKGTF